MEKSLELAAGARAGGWKGPLLGDVPGGGSAASANAVTGLVSAGRCECYVRAWTAGLADGNSAEGGGVDGGFLGVDRLNEGPNGVIPSDSGVPLGCRRIR